MGVLCCRKGNAALQEQESDEHCSVLVAVLLHECLTFACNLSARVGPLSGKLRTLFICCTSHFISLEIGKLILLPVEVNIYLCFTLHINSIISVECWCLCPSCKL